MLLRFEAANYRSILEPVELSMIAVDEDRLVFNHRGDPRRDHSRVRAVGVLTRAKNVEVAQRNGFKSVALSENLRVQLVDSFGNRVRRETAADSSLDLRQGSFVAIDRTA